jgi:peptidoglycan/xylan/chitin deacetylase (PgdA/CDA1 family)
MLTTLKSIAVRGLALPGLNRLFAGLTRDRVMILMLHRFRDPERGVEGHDPSELRRALEFLRRERYALVPLEDVFRLATEGGPPLQRAVVFTIDDGYLDHALVAAPIFAEFDCPVTTFVTTGFLDGRLWMWWNRVEYVFRHTARRELTVEKGTGPLRYVADPANGFADAKAHYIGRCKVLPDREKHEAITRLASAADVELPESAPPEYAPMSWDQLRACEDRTMTFGPHTVTHPVLSMATDDQARYEIEESWRRLRAEARRPAAVFAYPNGKWQDFGAREYALLAQTDLLGAVVGEHDYADLRLLRRDPTERFKVRRFAYPDDLPVLIQLASGAERAKQLLRGAQ